MKKVVRFLLMITILFTITGCGEKSKETVKIELNANNFSDYIILNVQLEDYERETTTGLITTYEYRGAATLKATTSLKKEVKVEDIVIKGKITTSGMCWNYLEFDFELILDKDGKAEFSKRINTGKYGLMSPEEPSLSKFYSNYINPYELKEGEFYADDNEYILITSVTGSVYEEQ